MSGSVRQETNGSWTYQFWVRDQQTGRRKNVKRRGFRTKREADRGLRGYQSEVEATGYRTETRWRLADFLMFWLAEHTPGLSPATVDRYENIVSCHLIPALGSVVLKELNVLHIERFLREKRSRKYSDETVHGMYRVLRTALEAAVRWQFLSQNVAHLANAPKVRRREVPTISPEDQSLLVARLRAELRPNSSYFQREGELSARLNLLMVTLGLCTGLRRGELCGLQVKDIDVERSAIQVMRNVVDMSSHAHVKTPKNGRFRRVEVDRELLNDLVEHADFLTELRTQFEGSWNEAGWLFPNHLGGVMRPRALYNRFRSALKRAGLSERGYGIHSLRHTHISQALMQGVPIKIVSDRVGHSSIAVTCDRYGHVMPSLSEGVIESLAHQIRAGWV